MTLSFFNFYPAHFPDSLIDHIFFGNRPSITKQIHAVENRFVKKYRFPDHRLESIEKIHKQTEKLLRIPDGLRY